MSRPAARRAASALAVVAAAVGVPALAQLATSRDAEPAQISINTALPAFQVAGMVPGDYVVRCLRVRNEGSAPIRLVSAASITGDLAQNLRVAVERGTGLGDVGPSCLGFNPDGTFGFGTKAGGVAPSALTPETDPSWAAGPDAAKSLRITVLLPSNAPNAAIAKSATIAFAFAGTSLSSGGGGGGSGGGGGGNGGGVATGTTGGYDVNGDFISNSKVKKLFRVGKARLRRNGDVVVGLYLPAGGAVRAKVILPGGTYYAHRLYKRVLPGKLIVVLHRRPVGRIAVTSAKRSHRGLVSVVTTRYRWAHGPDAYVQPEQMLTLVRR
jgi:hypothetical protein